jgi:hypothetical protein
VFVCLCQKVLSSELQDDSAATLVPEEDNALSVPNTRHLHTEDRVMGS